MKWTEEEKCLIVKLYKTHTCREIGKIIGRTSEAVTTRLSMMGKSNKGRGRRHDVDYNYSSVVDPEQAYWAGFIAADGCLYERGFTLTFLLQQKDYLQLQKFKEACSYSGPVRFGTTPTLQAPSVTELFIKDVLGLDIPRLEGKLELFHKVKSLGEEVSVG